MPAVTEKLCDKVADHKAKALNSAYGDQEGRVKCRR